MLKLSTTYDVLISKSSSFKYQLRSSPLAIPVNVLDSSKNNNATTKLICVKIYVKLTKAKMACLFRHYPFSNTRFLQTFERIISNDILKKDNFSNSVKCELIKVLHFYCVFRSVVL